MTSAAPVVDLEVWGRLLLGVALVLWLPGHVWVARHCHRMGWPLRAVAAVAVGMLLAPAGMRLLNTVGLEAPAWIYVPVIVILGWILGRLPAYRCAMRALDVELRIDLPLGPMLAMACALAAVTLILGFHDFTAPPHVHDASNHAFLTWRVAETGSVQADTIFADPYGAPGLPYLVGLHASAALIAGASGLAPYLCAWLLPLLTLILLPASLVVLWNEWKLSPLALGIAALIAASCRFVPPGVLTWGGLGVVVGMFMVPWVALVLTRFWRVRSVWLAVMAGGALGTLAHIHGSEVIVALLAAIVTVALRPTGPKGSWLGWLLMPIAAALALGLDVLSGVGQAYLEGGMQSASSTSWPVGTSIERFLKAGGTMPHFTAVWVLALGYGLWKKPWRPIAVASLAVGTLALALATWRDPISLALTTPLYREPWRVHYVLLLFAPALMGVATARGLTSRLQNWPRRRTATVGALLALAFFVPPQFDIHHLYRGTQASVPFSPADHAHALRIAEVVGDEEWIANAPNDGSTWAMHVSGCRFVLPASWHLHDRQGAWPGELTQSLMTTPWPDEVSALRERGVRYVYASDTRYEGWVFERRFFDQDPRFEPAVVGETSTLYRILW